MGFDEVDTKALYSLQFVTCLEYVISKKPGCSMALGILRNPLHIIAQEKEANGKEKVHTGTLTVF